MVTKLIPVERRDRKSQGKLTRLEALAQALLRSTGLGIYIAQEGKFQYVNLLFQDLTGYTEKELLGKYSLDLVHPEDRDMVRKKAIENLKGQAVYPYEYRLIKKNGDLIWVLENLASAEYKGKPTTLGSLTDITERKQVEEALRESEGRYRHLCTSINEAVALFRFPDLEISYWNKHFEEYAKQVYAKNVEDITMSDIVASFEADEWDRAMGELDKVLASEPRPEIQEFRIKDAEGKKRIIEAKPALYKEKGQVVGIQVAITDITERKQAEEARREAERRYRAIFDNRLQMVFIHDEQGRFLEANDVALEKFGYTRDDFGNVFFQDIIHPDDLETAFQAVAEIRTKGYYIGHPIEIRIFSKSGEMLWAECVDVALEQEGERFLYIGIARDITERKQAEEALRESQERYSRLYEGINEAVALFTVPDFRISHWNKRFEDLQKLIIAKDTEDVTITDMAAAVEADDWNRAMEDLAKKLAGEPVPELYEIRIRDLEGKRRVFEVKPSFYEEKGQIAGVQVAMTDITERKQAEEALRESQERYSRLYEGINEAVALFELPDLRISHWNRRYEDLHKQMIAKDIESTTISDLAPAIEADDWNMAMEGIAKLLAGGPPPDISVYEIRMNDLEGKRRVIEVKTSFYEEKGQVVGVQVAMADITERKQAEEALRESEERYSQLYRGVNEAVAVCRLPDLKYSYWNKRFEEYAKQVYGKDVEDLSATDIPPSVEADDWNMAMEALAKTLAGEPVPKVYELRIKDAEGNRRVIEAKPSFYKEKGQVVGIQVMIADITERKQAEEALRESEELFRSLFESMSEGVILMDATGRVLQANPAAEHFLGFQHSESGELRFDTVNVKVTHPDGIPMLPQEMPPFRALKEKRPITTDLTGLKHPDGTIFWFIVNAIPIFGSNNELSGVFTTFTDTTERKRAGEEREALLQDIKEINRKLEESNKALQDFAYIASHDLREPLRKISSFGALLQDSLEGKLDEDQQENFKFMIDGSQRMQDMIDDLLTYSRLTTRAKPPQRVDLNDVIENLKKLELAALLDETKGSIHVPKPLPPVQADLSQMHQLFQNLIGNGLKFHKERIPPKISIRARQVENNMIRIEVEDNGIGIDDKYHEQLFVMFKRLHSREQYEGTGIGLAASKKIVERHGGSIGLKSRLGEGSTFWFTLPRGSYSGDS
jgi:PAS domain S-box-containing protein